MVGLSCGKGWVEIHTCADGSAANLTCALWAGPVDSLALRAAQHTCVQYGNISVLNRRCKLSWAAAYQGTALCSCQQ
jgi:hypothetical protein